MNKTDYFGKRKPCRRYPKDDVPIGDSCKNTYYCELCRYSRKGLFPYLAEFPICPHCNEKLKSFHKGQVSWSKKNKLRKKRRKNYN